MRSLCVGEGSGLHATESDLGLSVQVWTFGGDTAGRGCPISGVMPSGATSHDGRPHPPNHLPSPFLPAFFGTRGLGETAPALRVLGWHWLPQCLR